jgi:hypothetical protein
MGRSDDSSSSDEEDISREKKERKRKRSSRSRKSERKERKKRKKEYDDYSSSSDDDSCYKDRKSHKKDRKKKKKKHKKDKKRERREEDTASSSDPLARNYALADALSNLLEEHPALVEDFPLLLIRLASGTTFDLSQMTNSGASEGISRVFSCLEPFGVMQDTNGSWMWRGPENGSNDQRQQLFLVKLVRAMLDQIGFTIEAIEEFEHPRPSLKAAPPAATSAPPTEVVDSNNSNQLEQQTASLLEKFQKVGAGLAKDLAGLCNMILEGESIALDELPDERLRTALETLFVECGLEKSEMDEEDDSDQEGSKEDTSPTFGYGLPEENENDVRSRLDTVLRTCTAMETTRPRIKGPMPRPESYTEAGHQEESVSSEDEGPLPVGARGKGPTISSEMIRAGAARRSRQLESIKQGIDASVLEAIEGQAREEWMLIPGKFDFLSAVKSGQPIRNRKFEALSKAETSATEELVDPSIQAEIDAIKQAHEESRGPSLLEQHREKKAQEAEEAAGKQSSWKWSRDKDLDAGRRVDKNNLNMIFGGAGSDLKKKFQGGFG